MSQNKIIGEKSVAVNEEGYLLDFKQWDPQVAETIARESQVELGPKHWEVIQYLQDQHKKEVPLNIRKVGNSGVVSIKEFYALFPQGPLKTSTKIAGIPKPASCI
ncbi:MAG TPA: TusE/DsrC/DsvC family sulfur relay protein [Bacteroidia bacterium]|nr:TusE/DsrC/DsvC family sulfur relay protein [Bacteroidia bacterium]